MSKLKRFASVMLALVMCFGLTVTAFADSYDITITNSVEGYTYTAYQVFDGDVSGTDDNAKMANIVWGSNVNYTTAVNNKTIYQALAEISYETTDPDDVSQTITVYPFTSDANAALTSASAVAAALADCSGENAVVQAFAEAIKPYLTAGTAATSSYSNGTYTIGVTDVGYYLVETTALPQTGNDGDNGGYTRYILTLVDSTGAEANTKSDSPIVDKEIAAEDVDANIGDTINYTLTATLPNDYSSYDSYTLVFHDVMSSGLTFDGSDKVTVKVYDDLTAYKNDTTGTGGTIVSSGYTVVTDCYHEVSISAFDGSTTYYTYSGGTYTAVASGATYDADTTYYVKADCTFEVQIDDTKTLQANSTTISTSSSSIIVVTFTATLNSNAVIGDAGNPNDVYLEYSNNPNSGGEGSTGTTPKDRVITWTYTLKVTKVDGSETTKTLPNAVFVLYRQINDLDEDGNADIEYVVVDADNKVTGWTPYIDDQAAIDAGVTSGYTVASTFTSGSDGVFNVIGLDDDVDTYYLKEVTAPTGYNLPSEPFEVKITATHTANDGTDSSTSTINTVDLTELNGLAVTVDNDNGTGTVSTGVVSINVENNEGIAMPSTGGIGTTIFYVVGGVLVVGAVVLLITRKRMQDDQ